MLTTELMRTTDWEIMKKKVIRDTDGFYTDLALYSRFDEETEEFKFIIMFGDTDLYEPDADYSEYGELDDIDEALEKFTDYGDLDEYDDGTHIFF